MGLERFARRTLRSPLRDFGRLTRRRERSVEVVRFIHKLRVSSRRADAALRLLKDVLPARRTRTLRQALRDLRRAAGKVRDLDVFLERLEQPATDDTPTEGNPSVALVSELQDRRATAAAELDLLLDENARTVRRQMDAVLQRVAWRGADPRPGTRTVVGARLAHLIDAARTAAAADLAGGEALHEFRIACKRVRYAVELVGPVFGNRCCDSLLTLLAEIQEHLGACNDHRTAIALLIGLRHGDRRWEVDPLIAAEEQSLAAAQDEFLDWWRSTGCGQVMAGFAAFPQFARLPATVAEESRGIQPVAG